MTVVSPVSRSTAEAASSTSSATWRKALSDLKNLVECAKIAATDDEAAASSAKWFKLNPEQLGRKYLGEAGKRPDDEAHHVCINPNCEHHFVDMPNENMLKTGQKNFLTKQM